MFRRTFLTALVAAPGLAKAHTPWGHYAVYRQKHLLVLSTRDDLPSYPYSKRLVEAINFGAPEASARPARAKDLRRAYDLLRTDQFQFALLSSANVAAMREASGPFEGDAPVDLATLYVFGDLEFVVRADFPVDLAAIVSLAVLNSHEVLPEAMRPEEIRGHPALHPGAELALLEYLGPQD